MIELHRSEDPQALLDALGSILAVPGPDPFAPAIVAIPTRGVERWLTQSLATVLGVGPGSADGVCANVKFPLLANLLDETAGRATGIDPDEDPWPARRAVWPLIEIAGRLDDQPWFAPLAASLDASSGRRYSQLDAIARRYDRYGRYRPQMLRRWAAGKLTVAERADWQAPLWLALREHLATPSPAERLPDACANLLAHPQLAQLPERLTVFGLRNLAAAELELLSALAAHRDLHLFIIDASNALWHRRLDTPNAQANNRLLAAWGREIGGLESLIAPLAARDHHHPPPASAKPMTLLARLQATIATDAAPGSPLLPGGETRTPPTSAENSACDDSIQIHSCHGATRQVEVLREAILHRLADDPTLECRDILVMCPNVERFAPLIEASFGGAEGDEPNDGPPALPVRIADRASAQTNPLLGVLGALLELVGSRLTAAELLDFADREPVRSKFGFDDEALAQLREWACETAVHWGFDLDDRARYRLGTVRDGTWQFGLDRLLLSVATGDRDTRPFEAVAPLSQLPSSAIELAGRVTELVDRLKQTVNALRNPQTPAALADILLGAIDQLTLTGEDHAWQSWQVQSLLHRLVVESAGAPTVTLEPAETSALLARLLRGRPSRTNFRSGAITLCGFAPLRAMPYRVICLLGLDDGTFPRRLLRDGDDLLEADPQPGDRDPRDEDRQMLLETLTAARDALIITYTGNDERTNAPRPPALPVGELLDAIDELTGVGAADARTGATPVGGARSQVRLVHPLAACDPLNFTRSALIPGGAWSFDASALAGAKAARMSRTPSKPLFSQPLPQPPDDRVIALEDLIYFVSRPAKAFFRQRLGMRFDDRATDPSGELPIELDGSERYEIGRRWLDARIRGIDGRTLPLDERARGTLPAGDLAQTDLQWLIPRVNGLASLARSSFPADPARSIAINLSLDDRTRITGIVGSVRGSVLCDARFGRLGPGQRLSAWVRLLALTVNNPDQAFSAALVARTPIRVDRAYGAPPAPDEAVCVRFAPLGGDREQRADFAREELTRLVSLWREGMCEPLPLPPRTAAAYAEHEWLAARSPTLAEDPLSAAQREWQSTFRCDGEDRDPEHRLAFGENSPLPPIGDYASRLWRRLLEHQTQGPR